MGRFSADPELDPGAAAPALAPDERLVEQAVAGDRDAFEGLVRRHHRSLVNHLFRLTGQREEALDLAQEAFLKVHTSLASFDPKYRFTTWLYRIASNCAIDYLRKKQIRTCPIGHPELTPDAPAEVALRTAVPSPHEALRIRELKARLEQAIRSLPPDYRHLILLRHRQHCRYDEIARITRLPMGTVKNRIFRAREILRSRMAGVIDGDA